MLPSHVLCKVDADDRIISREHTMKIAYLKYLPAALRSVSATAMIATALAGGAVLQSGSDAQAAFQTISCPLENLRREVTTDLPEGWWSTPQIWPLQTTRIIELGGRTALQCDYGPSGSIQIYAPDAANCEARAAGFRCESTAAAPVPRTYSTGEINIPQTYLADLDRGRVGSVGADIWFQADTPDQLYLAPKNGSAIGVGDRSNRGYSGCSTARFTNARVLLRDIPVGSYVCLRTDQGRISQFRVNRISGGSPKSVTIGYTTYE
tara:strand:+ start:2315 stop:3109 length:795 start_codon:yes stop_codon:yes gene_type:complete